MLESSRTFEGASFVIVMQERRTSDIQFGRLGDAYNGRIGREGHVVYTFLGKSSKYESPDELIGICVCLPKRENKILKKSLENLLDDNLDAQNYEGTLTEIGNEILGGETYPGGEVSNISLSRDGKIEIGVLKGERGDEKDTAAQAFSFIRDICHVHQHHAGTTDIIVDVVPASDGEDEWRRETLNTLCKWITQMKRTKDSSAYVSAKGVLAYARAFERLHCDEDDGKEKNPNYLWSEISDSLDAGLAGAKQEEAKRLKIATVIFNRLLPAVGVFLLFLRSFTESQGESELTYQERLASQIANFISDNILLFGGALILSIIIGNFSIINRSWYSGRERFLDVFRIIFPIRFWVIVAFYVVLLSTVSYLGYAIMNWLLDAAISPTFTLPQFY